MARTEEQKSPRAAPPESGGERKSFFSRFIAPHTGGTTESRNASSSRSSRPPRQQSRLGKLMFGWLILLVVVELGSTGLNYLNVRFNLGLLAPWFHTNAFLIGGINWFYTINLVLIVGAYYFLVRFDLIPRDLFTPRSQTATGQNQTGQPGRASPDGMGKPRRTRAARRHAASNPPSVTSTASTRRTSTTKARAATPPPPSAAPTGHDEEYYRVKAAQRQIRRREAKR
jgi:cytoskeletal protein RodZ